MGYVFISYSTKNQTMADSMKRLLTKNNIDSWMAPNDIPVGEKYAKVINSAIKNCSCVILMLSEAAQNSSWVPKEIERAVSYKKMILPVKLEEMELNDEFSLYLSTDQIVAIKDFDEDSQEIKRILKSVSVACNSFGDSNLSDEPTGINTTPSSQTSTKKIFTSFLKDFFDVKSVFGKKADADRKPLGKNKVISICALVLFIVAALIVEYIPYNTAPQKKVTQIARIPFINMYETEKYIYPFEYANGFSSKMEIFFMKDKTTQNLSMVTTGTGSIIGGNENIDIKTDPQNVLVMNSKLSDIIYFWDQSTKKIRIYDSLEEKWINQDGIDLPLKDTEDVSVVFSAVKNLHSKINIDENDMYITVYDSALNGGCYSQIIHVTYQGQISAIDISHLNLTELVCGMDSETDDNMSPALAWDSNEKLVVFDILSGQRIDAEYSDICEKYMRYANEDIDAISPNKQYIIRKKTIEKNDLYVNQISAWNVKTGKFYSTPKGSYINGVAFAKDSKLIVYENGRLIEKDLENDNENELLSSHEINKALGLGTLPYSFWYSSKLDICIWETAIYNNNIFEKDVVTITDLNGNILYRDITGEFLENEMYHTHIYFGDDFILRLIDIYEEDEEGEYNYAKTIPLKVSYYKDKNGDIKFR